MSPALVNFPFRDIKLLLVSDEDLKCSYWIHPFINSGSANLPAIVRHFKPLVSIPEDPLYWRIYRRIKSLEAKGYIKTTIGKSGDYGEALSIWIVPTDQYFTLLSRMQNSNRFLNSANLRSEWSQLKQEKGIDIRSLGKKKKKCPYYLSSRTKQHRVDAVFKMRTLRRHSYFRRRDKKIVNPELSRDLEYVQDRFDHYIDDVQDLRCALVHKEDGHIKLIDYQTRFTDESRKASVIARYYRSWEKAGDSYNTGVFLTLTSYPPSEAPKHLQRSSLWHVDRYYAVSWNAYMSLLTKRNRAGRREDLLFAKREEIKKLDPARALNKAELLQLTREERAEALKPMREGSFRPPYLQVYEFMKNGLLHGHCVIFGKHWLDKFEQIKEDWRRIGQGERIHIYGIHKEGDVWKWSKERPKDSRNREPIDYLMKYLGKGVRISAYHGLYWAINKRFFTNSRSLLSDQDLGIQFEKLPAQYEFLGSFKGEAIPVWLLMNQRAREISARAGGLMDPLGWPIDPGGARVLV